jgi:hypothetical protein
MTPTPDLVFSDAELTYLAIELDKPYFPATPPPTLDPDGWGVVQRGLVARGVLGGRFRLSVDDDVAEVIEMVLTADLSLWTGLLYAPGAGENRGQILWLRDDAVVRQTATPDGTTTLLVCDRRAVDDMLAEVADFPDAALSEAGPPLTLPLVDFHEAVYATSAESPAAAGARYPAASGYVEALAEGRSATWLERRSAGEEPERREKLWFAESRAHGLWLAHDDPHVAGELTGVMTRVQRVTVDMAREEANALVYEDG